MKKQDGGTESSDDSEDSEVFRRNLRFYEDNARDNKNMGFKVQPLCPKIFGRDRSMN